MREAFLDYLVQSGLVPEERLRSLRSAPQISAEPIGRIALQHGMVTGGDVDRVLRWQGTHTWRFGEIAVELDVLTPPQLERLLAVQRMRLGYELVEALVLGGLLDAEEAWSVFARFLLGQSVPGSPQA